MMKVVLGGVAGLVVVLFLIGIFTDANDPLQAERYDARRAIELCDGGAKDDLQDRGTRLFIRGVCDKMRRNYQTKYGSAP